MDDETRDFRRYCLFLAGLAAVLFFLCWLGLLD